MEGGGEMFDIVGVTCPLPHGTCVSVWAFFVSWCVYFEYATPTSQRTRTGVVRKRNEHAVADANTHSKSRSIVVYENTMSYVYCVRV